MPTLPTRARVSLCVCFWRLQPQLLHYHLQVLPRLALLPRIAQQKRWMVRDRELASIPAGIIAAHARRFEVVEAPAQLDHRSVHRQQGLGGGSAEGHDHLRFDHRNLSHQERRAGRALVALRLAISRRAALYDVRDVNLLALDPHRLDHIVKQLPGAPDEGLALFSFIGTPPLAEEPQLRLWI